MGDRQKEGMVFVFGYQQNSKARAATSKQYAAMREIQFLTRCREKR